VERIATLHRRVTRLVERVVESRTLVEIQIIETS